MEEEVGGEKGREFWFSERRRRFWKVDAAVVGEQASPRRRRSSREYLESRFACHWRPGFDSPTRFRVRRECVCALRVEGRSAIRECFGERSAVRGGKGFLRRRERVPPAKTREEKKTKNAQLRPSRASLIKLYLSNSTHLCERSARRGRRRREKTWRRGELKFFFFEVVERGGREREEREKKKVVRKVDKRD